MRNTIEIYALSYAQAQASFNNEVEKLAKMKEELDEALKEKNKKGREFEAYDKEYKRINTEFKRKYQKKYKYLFKLRDIVYFTIIKPITFCITVILAGLSIGIGMFGFNEISKILESFLIDISYELYLIAFGISGVLVMAVSASFAFITYKKCNKHIKEWRRNLYKNITKKIDECIEQRNSKLKEYQEDHSQLVQKRGELSASKQELDGYKEAYNQTKSEYEVQKGIVRYFETQLNPTITGPNIGRRRIPYYYPTDDNK